MIKPLILSKNPIIRAFNCDCMDYMKNVSDNHFDLACVDPPYTDKIKYENDYQFEFNDDRWKSRRKTTKTYCVHSVKPTIEYFDELRRVSKNQIIWGGNYFELSPTPCVIVWNKKNGDTYFSDCELAWTSFDSRIKMFEWLWSGFRQEKGKEQRIHPTQKPVALYRWLLQNYAKAGQRILDTHGGSFSSAVACHTEGYEMDICEIDKEYFDAGVKRFKEATCQLKLAGV